MLNWQGHIRIVDFGLSKDVKEIDQKNHSFIGTPGYVSPEISLKLGHNFLTDVYNIGIFLYDVLHGCLPFDPQTKRGKTVEQLEEMHKKLLFKEGLSFEAQHLITKLMSVNPQDRLDGDTDILSMLHHPWFKGNHKYINSRFRPTPPYTPDYETHHFSRELNGLMDLYLEPIESKPR